MGDEFPTLVDPTGESVIVVDPFDPQMPSVLEADLRRLFGETALCIVEPTPLHLLLPDELRELDAAFAGPLALWERLKRVASATRPPGWVSQLVQERQFITDALASISDDDAPAG